MVGWLYNTCLQRLYLLAVLFFNSAAGDLLRGVEVPQFAVAGGQARVSCFYDLRTTKLYSLKWYHNSTEFYRYVPTERNRAINIKPTHKFSVAELFRNERQVSLSLTKLAIAATGHYRCEVIAEHPSFRTEASTASMTVAAAGGTLKAECRMTLGTFTLSSFKTLRVRVRLISYVGTYQSPANQWKARIMLTSVMVFIPVHFNLL
ncbi:putative Immunoglobulin V-set domain-containing protein 4 [Homarus americanus]|uniref:Putative Immunoglobulin V-set domain-containing protein 4 n=1 Tax=Homarus americanus TaxID=6706 RepID=A0A8J5NDZ5_HOMAM|nr:putative Immunoglobulin V-set domain-containing protein 4 [Homarus americanus]